MDQLQQRPIKLIEPLIAADAQERVERTVKQFNQIVREHIRTEKLSAHSPAVLGAYERLFELQTGPYLGHEKWLEKAPKKRGETVRFALLQARTMGAVTEDGWNTLLTQTSEHLKAAPGKSNDSQKD